MSPIARTVRTSERIRAEIEQTSGFLPPFFEHALANLQVLDNLWQQTLSTYLQNPLSVLFKERLNALLSHHCAAPYCSIVHSAVSSGRMVPARREAPNGSLCHKNKERGRGQ